MAERPVVRERGHATDVAGVLVLGACVLWSLICAAGRDARPEGVVLAVLAVAAGYAVGRIVGTLLPVAAATAAALGLLGLVLFPGDGVPGAVDTAVPMGRTGASAALLVLAAGAACCAAAAAGPGPLRAALRVPAVAAVGAAAFLGSAVGLIASVGVLLCSLAAARMRRRVLGLAGFALTAGLAVGGSWAVAEDALPQGAAVSAEGLLTGHRVLLWRDAVVMVRQEPVLGVGPDRFGELSPTAQQTLYADGKPHSAALQQAAEQGVPGIVLLGAAYGWLLWGLASSPRPTPVVFAAGASLTALAVLASVGNVLSFTPVTAAAGLLAGLATARTAAAPSAGTDAVETPRTPERWATEP